LLAKAAIDNCRAGRAAKGANPFVMLVGAFFVGADEGLQGHTNYCGFTRRATACKRLK